MLRNRVDDIGACGSRHERSGNRFGNRPQVRKAGHESQEEHRVGLLRVDPDQVIDQQTTQFGERGHRVPEAAAAMGRINRDVYRPDQARADVYDELYAEYVQLHDYFGRGANQVMHRLRALRDRVRKAAR